MTRPHPDELIDLRNGDMHEGAGAVLWLGLAVIAAGIAIIWLAVSHAILAAQAVPAGCDTYREEIAACVMEK